MLTEGYRKQLEKLHQDPDLKWGNDGKYHVDAIWKLAGRLNARTLLDFGCGRSTLSKSLKSYCPMLTCTDYDPGRPKKAKLPNKVFDVVTCTDVLEHVEPEFVDEVIKAIADRAGRAAYFVIDTVPANVKLPDGRNAHLTVREPVWWAHKLTDVFKPHLWFARFDTTPKKVTAEIWRRE